MSHRISLHGEQHQAIAAQVGTRDGRVKIFGSDGVECTFRSPFQTATKQLQFLENKGALLRLTTVCTCTALEDHRTY